MYQRYYDGYESCDSSIESGNIIPAEHNTCDDAAVLLQPTQVALFGNGEKVVGPLAVDDIILIGVLLFLLHEECDDKLMIVIIGFVLLAGFLNE